MVRVVLQLSALLCVTVSSAKAGPRNLGADLQNLDVRLNSDHYALAGTASDARLNEFAAALEFIHAEYAAGFAELLADQNRNPQADARSDAQAAPESAAAKTPASDRFSVVVLAKEGEYKEFTHAYFNNQLEHTRGLFVPSVDLLVILDIGNTSETYATLFQEAFHQFLHRHVPLAPMWVNEGLATYYETARPTGAGLVFDRPRDLFFQVVKEAADAKLLISFDALLSADRSAFYDSTALPGMRFPRSVLHYAQAYTLCAFIVNDGEGRLVLRRYLQSLAGARGEKDVLRITRESFPPSLLEALVAPWLQYVNKY